MSVRGHVGSFLLRRNIQRSVRQKYETGPQYNKRQHFKFAKGTHYLARRMYARHEGSPTQRAEHRMYSHYEGDLRRRPDVDYSYDQRQDGVQYAWKPRGKLQVFQMAGAPETFVCFRCGYPVKSRIQVIKNKNWDYRMCYNCYLRVVSHDMADKI